MGTEWIHVPVRHAMGVKEAKTKGKGVKASWCWKLCPRHCQLCIVFSYLRTGKLMSP